MGASPTDTEVIMNQTAAQAKAEAHKALIDAWHAYLATLPPAERLARLTL